MTTTLTRRPGRSAKRAAGLAIVAALASATAGLAPAAQAAEPNPTITVLYDAVGTSGIKGQVNKDLPIGPTVLSSVLDTVTSGIVDGALPIPSKQITFNAIGLTLRATVNLTQVGKLTGTLTPTGQRGKLKLSSNVSYDIRLSDVAFSFFGLWTPLSVGSNCHTANPVNITAATPDGEFFTINGGGRVTGTYTIGNFTGCSFLNILGGTIDSTVAGPGNTIDITLSNPRNGG